MSNQPIGPTALEQYRKTLIPIQLMILTLCVTMKWIGDAEWSLVIMMFVCLQLFAFAGAFWAASLSRRILAKRDRLPLADRRKF